MYKCYDRERWTLVQLTVDIRINENRFVANLSKKTKNK